MFLSGFGSAFEWGAMLCSAVWQFVSEPEVFFVVIAPQKALKMRRHSVNEGFGEQVYRKGNSLKRSLKNENLLCFFPDLMAPSTG